MGFPTGWDLRLEILKLPNPDYRELAIGAGLFEDEATLRKFVDAFRMSQMYSIDAFLARRPEFTEIGKLAIATVLLEHETKVPLDRSTHKDAWYQYLWNRFADMAWEELDLSRLRIVTFNYDRSLEHYLMLAIQNAHGKSHGEAIAKLDTLEIVHVYGRLGESLPRGIGTLNYGIGPKQASVQAAAKTIQVIPEGRNDDAVLKKAKDHLLWADRIGFLGFGFDPTNMERLDTTQSCKRQIVRPAGVAYRTVYATCLGMTDAEIRAAQNLIWPGNTDFKMHFEQLNCLDMLRETALLV